MDVVYKGKVVMTMIITKFYKHHKKSPLFNSISVYFDIFFGRHLPNSSLEILKEIGHGVNIEAPITLNNLIISFVLGVP